MIALQGWWSINEAKKRCECGDNWLNCLFKGLKNMWIPIDFNDVQSLTNFQAHLSDKWLNFMLIHTFAKNVLNRNNYLLLTSQASSCLRNDVKNRGGMARWVKNFFKYRSNFVILWLCLIWLKTIGPCTYLRIRGLFTWILYRDIMITHQLGIFHIM